MFLMVVAPPMVTTFISNKKKPFHVGKGFLICQSFLRVVYSLIIHLNSHHSRIRRRKPSLV